MRIKFKFEESIMLDLNEFLKKENGKSGIAFMKAELRAEDYRLPFGGISSFCIDDENYNLFAKLEIKYSSIFPRIQDSRLTIYWENESQDVIIQKIEELTVKIDGVYTCGNCGKTAKDKTHLTRHVETHIEGLEYNCQHCGKVCRSRNGLTAHIGKYHRN